MLVIVVCLYRACSVPCGWFICVVRCLCRICRIYCAFVLHFVCGLPAVCNIATVTYRLLPLVCCLWFTHAARAVCLCTAYLVRTVLLPLPILLRSRRCLLVVFYCTLPVALPFFRIVPAPCLYFIPPFTFMPPGSVLHDLAFIYLTVSWLLHMYVFCLADVITPALYHCHYLVRCRPFVVPRIYLRCLRITVHAVPPLYLLQFAIICAVRCCHAYYTCITTIIVPATHTTTPRCYMPVLPRTITSVPYWFCCVMPPL